MPRPSLWLARTLAALAAGLAPAPVPARSLIDELREDFRDEVRAERLAVQFQSLINFTAFPDVAAASFTVSPGEARIDTFKLPFDREIPIGDRPFDLFVEGSLGYLEADQNLDGEAVGIESRWRSVTGLAGLGLSVPLGAHTRIRPRLNLSLAHLENDADFGGPLGPLFEAASAGILFDFDLKTAGIGASLGLRHEQSVDDLELTVNLDYHHTYLHPFDATEEVLEVDSHADIATGLLEITGPAGASLAGQEVRWAFLSATTILFGEQAEAFGFPFFVEVGGGFDVDLPAGWGVARRAGLRAAVIGGEDVRGWSVGLSFRF